MKKMEDDNTIKEWGNTYKLLTFKKTVNPLAKGKRHQDDEG